MLENVGGKDTHPTERKHLVHQTQKAERKKDERILQRSLTIISSLLIYGEFYDKIHIPRHPQTPTIHNNTILHAQTSPQHNTLLHWNKQTNKQNSITTDNILNE